MFGACSLFYGETNIRLNVKGEITTYESSSCAQHTTDVIDIVIMEPDLGSKYTLQIKSHSFYPLGKLEFAASDNSVRVETQKGTHNIIDIKKDDVRDPQLKATS